MRGITERRLRLRPPPLVLSFRPVYRSFCMRRLHRFPASSLCWGAWGPASWMSAMLLFYVLLVDKKKLVNPPMAKAMMKEERSIRELFFRALPIAIAPLLILITMLSGIFSRARQEAWLCSICCFWGICTVR